MIKVVSRLMAVMCLMIVSLAGQATAEPGAGDRLLMLSAGHTDPAKIKLLSDLAKQQGLIIEHANLEAYPPETNWTGVLRGFDLVILDGINAEETKKGFAFLRAHVAALPETLKVTPTFLLDGDELRKGVSAAQSKRFEQYFVNGGRENFNRMFVFLKGEILDMPDVGAIKPPIQYPENGIYHPQSENAFESPQAYLDWYKGRYGVAAEAPVVGIIVHRSTLVSDNNAMTDDMIRRIEDKGAVPLAFYYGSGREVSHLADWLTVNGQTVVNVLVNTRVIHWAEEQQKLFAQLGVTVVNAVRDGREEKDWRADNGGITTNSIPFYLSMPEIAGVVDPTVVAARNPDDERYYPIKEQMDLVVRKALRLVRLTTMANRDKKVAIFYYNYPPGERSAGASFLNVPRSIQNITARMKEEDYQTAVIEEQTMIDAVANLQRPYYREEDPRTVVDKGVGALLPVAEYKRWYAALPESVRTPMEDAWGQPEDHFMVADVDGQKQFVIPMFKSGNVMILPQPPRGDVKDRERAIYHSMKLPVNHHYLAVYLYVRKTFGADAIVHLGTHGSHEWLPGKERGLWAYDAGSLATDEVPVVYPYIVDDVGEAMQSKRRGHAVMVSHMTPPFAPSGLYREFSEVHDLVHQYLAVDPGSVKERVRKQIIEKLEALNIPGDIGWDITEMKNRFDTFMPVLHEYLHDVALQNQPLGLHTFGKLSEDKLIASTIMQILGNTFAYDVAEYLGVLDEDDHDPQTALNHAGMHSGKELENIPGFTLLLDTVMNDKAIPDDVSDRLRNEFLRGRELLVRIRGILELDSYLLGLDGKFVRPSTGGDPVRNDESLPTGRNLYGFDPSRLPTKAAFEVGTQLVKDLIDDYVAKHGKYPQKLALSLWSIEAMRHHGVLEAQAMYAMGLRPVWAESGRVTGTEIIPYGELKRPRIDVVLSATGLYRDAFPGVMKLLAEGVDKIARLKEEGNVLYRNTQKLREELVRAGVAADDADYLSTVRVFSAITGEYGTGLAEGVLASDTWDNDSRLAGMYLNRMGFAFGKDEQRWGEKLEGVDLFAKNLSGTDVALFARSSNLYGVLTSDDPFQNLGGLSLAVRNLDGKSPEMFISNLRNPNRGKMETLNAFMSKELRSRYFHPRWIEQMQDEGYAGALEIMDTVNNFWGWQVVDPQNIRADQWQEFFEVYVNDKYDLDMKTWFESSNPEALAKISERMLEAVRKGYWQADKATVEKLVETFQEMQLKYDVQTDNSKLVEFVAQQADGFGLQKPDVAPVALQPVNIPQPAMAGAQQVQGQKMEKAEQVAEGPEDTTWYMLLSLIVLTLLAGAAWQQWLGGRGRSSSVVATR